MEPNGTGKTTTVRTLSTLLVSTSGPTTVAGIPLTPANVVEIRRRDRQSEERHKRTFRRCDHCSALCLPVTSRPVVTFRDDS